MAALSLPQRSSVAYSHWREGLPDLKGPRVTLRELQMGDAPALHALMSSSEVARFTWPPPPSSKAFERATEFVKIDYIVFTEIDNARTAARKLRDKSIRRENIDGLPNGSLGNTESAGAGSFNDTRTRLHGAAYDLGSQFGGKGMLH